MLTVINGEATYPGMRNAAELQRPRYTQPTVLAVTRLKASVLQTWISRNAIPLADQNPGRGKYRLYSPVDVVKLAIMRRMADLRIELAKGLEIAEAGVELLNSADGCAWDEYIFLRPKDATEQDSSFTVIRPTGMSKLVAYDWKLGDPAFMRVSDLVEPDRFAFRRRPHPSSAEGISGEMPVDPILREIWAKRGIHAEPVIVFPLGEIINGTLVQLDEIDAGKAK